MWKFSCGANFSVFHDFAFIAKIISPMTHNDSVFKYCIFIIYLHIGFGIEAFCILGLRWVNDRHLALILLCVGVAFSGLAISGYQVNPLDLAPQYASVLTGLSRLGAVGAIMSTVVAGKLREEVRTVYSLKYT